MSASFISCPETRMTVYEGWVNFLGVPGLILRRR